MILSRRLAEMPFEKRFVSEQFTTIRARQKAYDELLRNLNIVTKCLAILLDKELLHIALLGTPKVRLTGNYHVHKRQELSVHLAGVLERIADLKLNLDSKGLPTSPLLPAAPVNGEASEELDKDLTLQTKRLSKWVYLSDGYQLSANTELEDGIDEYLEGMFKKENYSANDIALWKWLELFAPV